MKLSDLPVGALVKDTNTKYNNATIIWQVLEHGHTDDGATNTTLCSRDIITLKCFDAKEPNNSDSNRKNYGNNRYLHSNILQWLNSTGAANAWYTAQHNADQKPDSSNVWANSGTPINPYDTEVGFLTNFSAELRNALQTVTKVTAKNKATDGGDYESVSSKIFLLSNTEVGLSNENNVAEGTIYEYYSGANNTNDRRKKNLANDAAKGNYSSASSPWDWWLRTPSSGNSYYARIVYLGGTLHSTYAFNGLYGVAPAYAISSNTNVSSTTDADGAYTIVWNTLPTITTDTTSLGNKYEPFSINYTIDDNESDTVTYQIKMDGVTLTSGTTTLGVEQTFSVTSSIFNALPLGSHTIRITANDGSGEVYTDISFTVANKALKVVGSIGNIGEISSYVYSLNSTKARKRIIPFNIEKVNATITLSSNSVTLDSEHTSATVNVSTNGGTLSVNSSDTSVATASISGTTITIMGLESGNATVTVSAAESDNCFASSATISVSAEFNPKPSLVSWSSGTDAQIKDMVDGYYDGTLTLNEIKSVWSVGDSRTITLSAMSATGVGESHRSQSVEMVILDFDHDDLTTAIDGKTKALITVQQKNCLRDATVSDTTGQNNTEHGYMNSSNTNENSWRGCARRTWCNDVYYNALPSEFKAMVKQANHTTSTGNQQTTTEITADYCFLPSEWEVFGAKSYAVVQEGTQYNYYTTAANRYKLPKWDNVSDYWWERSPRKSDATEFCRVGNDGTAYRGKAKYTCGLAPACCF